MVDVVSQTNSIRGATPTMLAADVVNLNDMVSVGAVVQGIIVTQFPGTTDVRYWTDNTGPDDIVYVEIAGAGNELFGTFAYQLASETVSFGDVWEIPFSLFAAGLPTTTGDGDGGGDGGGIDGGMDAIEEVARRLPPGRSRQKDFRAGVQAACGVLQQLEPFGEVLPRRFQIAISALSIACEVTEVLPGVARKLRRFGRALRPF